MEVSTEPFRSGFGIRDRMEQAFAADFVAADRGLAWGRVELVGQPASGSLPGPGLGHRMVTSAVRVAPAAE